MKRVIFTFIGVLLLSLGFSQTILFQENFEGATISMTSSSASGLHNWGISSQLASQSLKSDTAVVAVSDTIYLTTATINCSTMSFVQFEFDQIAKMEFFDAGYLQISIDNGSTWTKITSGYLGTSQFSSIGNLFNSTAYTDWVPGNNNAVPTNSWWKHETFNLSSYAANYSQVKIRFVLADGNGSGAAGNYGWLIDNVKVTASFSELIPPSIGLISYPIDTAYTSGPFDVIAHVTDNTGIDTVYLVYSTTTGVTDTLPMNVIATDTFKASIPFYGYGRSISYYVKAIDSSPAANTDSVGPITFFCKYSPGGTFTVGTGTNVNGTTNYPCVFGQFYTGDKEQYLILASELYALNAVGGSVSSIAFDVTTINSAAPSGLNHHNFTIKLKNTTTSNLSTSFESGLTQVYTIANYQTVTGWNNFNFSSPFVWDGVSNLLVEVCFDNYVSGSDYSDNAIVNRTTTTHTSASYYRSDGGGVCSNGSSTTSSDRPNMQLVMATPSNITNDAGVYQITNPTGGVVANQAFPVKVKITNYGIDTLVSATINWKFDGVLQTPYSFTGQILPDSVSSEIQLGSKTVTGGSHSIVAWTDNPNGISDFNVANDSASINFFACGSLLNGTYTIGGSNPDYPTFSDAVLALNQCGISGPVVFNVASGTYNDHFEILPVNGSSSTNTVTFKSANGDSTSVVLGYDATGIVDNYVVKLNGASYITFKNMTIQAADSNYCRAIVMGGKLHDVNIANTIIKTLVPQNIDDSKASIIFTRDSIGANINIIDNKIVNGSRGIELFSNVPRMGWQVKNNTILGHYATGVSITSGKSSIIEGNIVQCDSVSTFDSYNGIALLNCTGSPMIFKNNILAKNTQIGYGIIAVNSIFDSANTAMIYNNFIEINANSSVNTLSGGIVLVNSPNAKIYYNTAHMIGNHTVSASMILFDQNATPNTENIVLKNNIFSNNAGGYIYYTSSIDTADFINNYNNLYNWNNGKFGHIGSSDITTYAAWKTQSGGDNLGDTIAPYYSGLYDLHVNNNLLNGRALPIAGIIDDIDGDTRSTTTPDIGADEFTPSPYDVTTLEVLTPMGACGLDTNETVTVRYKNVGSATINGNITGSYQIIGTSTVVTENITATINAGDTLDFVFATKANLSVANIGFDSTFVIKAWADLTGDNVKQNDTVLGDVESGYVPGLVLVADDTVTYGNKDTLYASGTNIYWWLTDTSSTELMKDTMFITPNLYDTTTYWVSDRAGIGLMDITFGGGTATNTSYGYPCTYANYFFGNKEQYLILASELQAMGISSGPISGISFEISTLNSLPPLDNFEISIGHTSTSSLSSWQSNLTSVFTQSSGYIPSVSSGWNSHTFSAPFVWDGVSNIVVQVCSNNSSWVSSGNASVLNHATTFTATINTHADAAGVCSNTGVNTYSSRPNMKLSYVGQGCFGERSPVTVYVTGFPQYDAGLDSLLLSPVGSIPAGTSSEVKAVLHNYGQVTITSLMVPYKINGVLKDTLFWSGSLAYGATDTIIIDTVTFNGGLFNVLAYCSMPNNVADLYNTNDTAKSTVQSCLSGTYTIGDTAGGAIFDFPSLTAAKTALSLAGVCGNVVFNVDSGTYNEQIIFTAIPGAGPNSTVTFQSANGDSTSVIWQFQPTASADNYVMKWNGVSYLRIKGMTLKITNTTSGTYGNVIDLTANANHNILENCRVISIVGTTSSSANPIYLNGTNVQYNLFKNNYFKNGYYGIRLYGMSSSNLSKGNRIEKNIIEDFYYYGMYLYYHDSLQVIGNTINNLTSFSNGYGIYAAYCQNDVKIMNNKVLLAPSGTCYSGIYVYFCTGTTARRGLIANNFVSITGTSTSATHYGMRLYYSNYEDCMFNSINMTSGSTSSRALDIYYGGNNNALNNYARNTGGGYAYYVSSGSSLLQSDYNNYYASGSNLAYYVTTCSNLAALQTASNKEVHSYSLNVPFATSTDLHILSSNLSAKAQYSARVPMDIDDEIRSTIATTIGADEVPLLPIDVGVADILYLPDSTYENYSTPFSVIVKNYGTDTVFAFDISYTVNSSTPVVYNYTLAFPPSAVDTVALTAFNSPAGNSTLCATTVLSTDSNTFNDGNCQSFFGIPTKDANVVEVKEITSYCGIQYDTVKVIVTNVGIDTINGTNQTVPTTISYQSNNNTVVTETFTNVVAPDDTVTYVFNQLVYLGTNNLVDSIYDIKAWIDFDGDNVQYNDSASTQVETLHQPSSPVVISPVNIPYGTNAILNASSPDNMAWYRYDTATIVLDTGSVYTTPYLYANDSFYVAALGGAGGGNITIGTGNNTSQYLPMNMFYGYTYSQSIYMPVDFNGSFGKITKIAYYYNGNSNNGPDAINIYMGISNKTSFSSASYDWVPYSDLTLVYSGTITTTTTAGWIEFTLDVPFIYNGTGNLVIGFDENTPGYHSSLDKFYCTQVSGERSIYAYSDTQNPDPVLPPTSGLSMGTPTYIANVKMDIIPSGCESSRSVVQVVVGSQSADDLGVISIDNPNTGVYLSATENVTVKVKNFGSTAKTNVSVNYSVNGGTTNTGTISSIPANDTATYTFAQKADLSTAGNSYVIKAYTSLTADATHLNDTTTKAVQHLYPNYCVSIANYASYTEITNVSLGTTFSNNSVASGALYTDFTQSVAPPQLAIGTATNFSVMCGFAPGYTTVTTTYMKIYVDYNRDGVFDPVSEEVYAGTGSTNSAIISSFTVPLSVAPGATAMRIVMQAYSSLASVTPCGTYNYGETEDYMVLIAPQIPFDAGVEMILQPKTLPSTSTVNVRVRVRNFGTDTITSLVIAHKLNGGTPVSTNYNTAIYPLDSADVNLGTVNLQPGANNLCAYTILAGDSNTVNDQRCKSVFREAVVPITYTDNLEGNDLWMPDTIVNQWERGVPAMTNINSAHSPSNVWGINLTGNYDNNSDDKLYTPRFLIPNSSDSAYFKFWHYYVTQSGTSGDGGYIQYRINSGFWANLGYIGDPFSTNWNTTNIGGTHMWNGNSNGWVHSSYTLNFVDPASFFYGATGDTVQFRFVFYSNSSTNNYDGWAIDDIEVSLPKIAQDGGVIAISSPGTSTQTGSPVTVTVQVKNFGTQNLTSIPLSYSVNSGTPVAATFTPTSPLLPDSVATYSFATSFNSPGTSYQLCAKTTVAGDVYTANDQTCKSVAATQAAIDGAIGHLTVSPIWPGPVDTVKQSFDIYPVVQVYNYGLTALSNVTVEYMLAAGTWTSEVIPGPIASGDSLTYQFATKYNTPIGPYTLNARIVLTGDADMSNNQTSKSLYGVLDIGIDGANMDGFIVKQNEPNPANGETRIDYYIPNAGKVKFELRNAVGQILIYNESNENAGLNTIKIDADKLANGVYYYTVEFNKTRRILKMVVN